MTTALYDYVQKEPAVTKYDQAISGVISAEDASFYFIFVSALLFMCVAIVQYAT